jgi:hypothetical protein
MSSNIKTGLVLNANPVLLFFVCLITQNLAAMLDAVFIGILLNDNATMVLTF